jgi:DNA polymerase-3 subunit epsilon
MDFVAIDFETANADYASICQVGAVTFMGGEVVDSFVTLVDPKDFFDGMNVYIHGIDEDAVRGAPTFPDIHPDLSRRLQDRVVVCHTSFDRVAFDRVHAKHRLGSVTCQWLDTARVVRRAWPDRYARSGYGLKNLASDLSIAFRHHDAGEDARAAGMILLRAIKETGLTLDEWLARVRRPIDPNSEVSGRITRDGNPDGPLFGEVAVFTGALSMKRADAADLAAASGCEVDDSVTKRTTVLIVGDQDVTKLADGQTKSSKHLKAEELVRRGQPIRILRETDFLTMCQTTPVRTS